MTSLLHQGVNSLCSLPEELLTLIVEFAALEQDAPYSNASDVKCIKALSLTCKLLRRLAQSLLYRNIEFSACDAKIPARHKRLMLLYRSLYRNTNLGKQCRSLSISIPDLELHDSRDLSITKAIIAYLPETRILSFEVGYLHGAITADAMEITWDLLRHISSICPAIQYLHLSRSARCLLVNHIFKYVNFPNLKSLHVDCISRWPRVYPQLELSKCRTAPFTHLSISNFADGKEALSYLIEWPAALSAFHFHGTEPKKFTGQMNCSHFQTWLLTHKETLTHITLGRVPNQRNSNIIHFKASLFPNLVFLQLCRRMMSYSLRFSEEDADLLGPSLKTFRWDFSLAGLDLDNDPYLLFDDKEVAWLHELATRAVTRKSALEKIEMEFCSLTIESYYFVVYSVPRDSDDCPEFPWAGLNRVRDKVLRPSGRELTYNVPKDNEEYRQICKNRGDVSPQWVTEWSRS